MFSSSLSAINESSCSRGVVNFLRVFWLYLILKCIHLCSVRDKKPLKNTRKTTSMTLLFINLDRRREEFKLHLTQITKPNYIKQQITRKQDATKKIQPKPLSFHQHVKLGTSERPNVDRFQLLVEIKMHNDKSFI